MGTAKSGARSKNSPNQKGANQVTNQNGANQIPSQKGVNQSNSQVSQINSQSGGQLSQGKNSNNTLNQANSASNSASIHCLSASRKQTSRNDQLSTAALPTALVKVSNNSNKPVTVRSFFDQGAPKTFITRSLKDRLQLPTVGTTQLSLSYGFDVVQQLDTYEIVKPVVALGKRIKRIVALVVDSLSSSIHTRDLVQAAKTLKKSKCRLADKFDSDVVTDLELLIGSDYYGRFINGLTSRCGIGLIQS